MRTARRLFRATSDRRRRYRDVVISNCGNPFDWHFIKMSKFRFLIRGASGYWFREAPPVPLFLAPAISHPSRFPTFSPLFPFFFLPSPFLRRSPARVFFLPRKRPPAIRKVIRYRVAWSGLAASGAPRRLILRRTDFGMRSLTLKNIACEEKRLIAASSHAGRTRYHARYHATWLGLTRTR